MRSALTAWLGAALLGVGCFTGSFLAGQPCAHDDECGPSLRCEQGRCGGSQASSSSGAEETTASIVTGAASSTGEPTTGTSTTGTSTSDPSTDTTWIATTDETDGTTTTDATTGPDPCEAATCRQVDLLFIVDDSPSIAQWQPALLDGLQGFAGGPFGALLRDSCDVHVGVLSTGAPYEANPPVCQGHGALVRVGAGECGGAYATEADDLEDALACRLALGSAGARDERPVQALLSAIDPERGGVGRCNDGFFRPDSLLVVVFATDEDDDADPEDELAGAETPGTPQQWFDAVVAVKGSVERVVMIALTGDLEPRTPCPWSPDLVDGTGAEAPTRLRAFIDLFPRRAVTSLCSGDLAGFVADEAAAALQAGCEAHAP